MKTTPINNFKLALIILFIAGCASQKEPVTSKILKKENFQKEINGKTTDLFMLENINGMKVWITNYGARIVAVLAKDKEGNFADVCLGYASIDAYQEDHMSLGCVVGPYANRIANGTFILDDDTFHLEINNNDNTLHSGSVGFQHSVWNASKEDNSLRLTYHSPHMEFGFPGNMDVEVVYTLTDENEIIMEYNVTTDRKTVLNLTNHAYFNLKGEGEGTILDHVVTINADSITEVDEELIPTGKILSIKGTPLDFTAPKPIGQEIDEDYLPLQLGNGYDHNFILNKNEPGKLELAAKVMEPESGRIMDVYTTEPAIQFYTGNFMNGTVTGKYDIPLNHREGFALEPQHYPDSPNQPAFPSVVVTPDEHYYQKSVVKFSTE